MVRLNFDKFEVIEGEASLERLRGAYVQAARLIARYCELFAVRSVNVFSDYYPTFSASHILISD